MNDTREIGNANLSLLKVVAWACMVFLPPALLFGAIFALAVNVPYWDDYDAIVRYLGWPFAERMQHVLDFHNEHRIVTVRLFIEAMVAVAGNVNFKSCMLFGSMQLLAIFASFAYVYFRQFGRRLGLVALAITSWHLFSMLNFDNAFWALTALENFGVLMWSFLAIILYCNATEWRIRLLAWICAALSILTSAQGLAVLGVFLLISAIPHVRCDSWRTLAGLVRQQLRYRTILMLLFISGAALMYFRGFVHGAESHVVASASVADRLLYVVAFLGNLVPIYPVAVICGCFLLVGVGYVTWNFPRIPLRMRPVYFFMLYCVGVAVAGVFFRASNPRAALSFRYYVITACFFVSLVGLLFSLDGKLPRIVRSCAPLLLIAFCALDVFVFSVGWSMFAERNEALRVNLLTWPGHVEGLRVEERNQLEASLNLKRLQEKGLYDPDKLLRDGEKRPQTPVPWPKPHFP